MNQIWKGDLYRLGKSRLLYGIVAVIAIIALLLTLLIRQDIRLGISIFGDLSVFRNADDLIRSGVRYDKGLGFFAAILISVFIGQEYTWKTWQHKWINCKSRTNIYMSKALLSSAVSVVIFLLFQAVILLCLGKMERMDINGNLMTLISGSFMYAALGAVLCMLSMLIRSNTASVIVCCGYIMFSETPASIVRNIGGFSETATKVSEWLVGHMVYGMSSIIHSTSPSPELVMHIILNAIAIMSISATFGLFFFRRYEL